VSADVLRRAAERLREVAGNATPGPWWDDFGGVRVGILPRSRHLVTNGFPNVVAITDRRGVGGEADAAYVATMHPGVAIALADWLDMYAVYVGNGGIYGLAPALAVARAILGETPDGAP
jgi:hypothetical protein